MDATDVQQVGILLVTGGVDRDGDSGSKAGVEVNCWHWRNLPSDWNNAHLILLSPVQHT